MTAHLGRSEKAKLSATVQAAKKSLVQLRKREVALVQAFERAQEFTEQLPTSSAADAYVQVRVAAVTSKADVLRYAHLSIVRRGCMIHGLPRGWH